MDIIGTSTLKTFVSYATAPEILWGVLGVVIGVTAAISAILHYHWRHYGVNRSLIMKAQISYFVGVILLLIIAFLSLLTFFIG